MLAFLDLFGIAIFAVSGAISAGEKKLDIFGVLVVALVTALGGGTLRDLFLDSHPLIWIADTRYLGVGILAALSAFFWVRLKRMPRLVLEICDAVGLAVFTLAGAVKALTLGHVPEIALLMGVITGVAGGILRDILCNEIPLIFHKEIYATAALLGCSVYLVMNAMGSWPGSVSIVTGALVILMLRLAGILYGWSLPAFLKIPVRR